MLRDDLDPHLLAVTYQGMVDAILDHLRANTAVDSETLADHVAGALLAGISRSHHASPADHAGRQNLSGHAAPDSTAR